MASDSDSTGTSLSDIVPVRGATARESAAEEAGPKVALSRNPSEEVDYRGKEMNRCLAGGDIKGAVEACEKLEKAYDDLVFYLLGDQKPDYSWSFHEYGPDYDGASAALLEKAKAVGRKAGLLMQLGRDVDAIDANASVHSIQAGSHEKAAEGWLARGKFKLAADEFDLSAKGLIAAGEEYDLGIRNLSLAGREDETGRLQASCRTAYEGAGWAFGQKAVQLGRSGFWGVENARKEQADALARASQPRTPDMLLGNEHRNGAGTIAH